MKPFFATSVAVLAALGFTISLCTGCSSGSSKTSSSTSTTTTLASSSTSTTIGASITLTATVSPAAATGTVTFYDGSTSLGTGTLSSGTATFSTTSLSTGTHAITATYGGNSSYASSSSNSISVTVSAASLTATTTTLTSTSYSTTAGSSFTLTGTLSSTSATGTIEFYDTTTSSNLGTVNISSGVATLTTSLAAIETHLIEAIYSGNSTYATSTSSSISIVINSSSSGGTSTTTSLTTASATAYPGSLVYLTATVSNSAASGSVTFSYTDGSSATSTTLGAVTLSNGSATLNTHFSSTGTYSITAAYSGDSTYSASTSSPVTETVASGSYSLDLSSYTCATGSTTAESVTVSYCLYGNVVYAANPVSSSYESMNIYVPASLGGTSVSGKPILFENGVGGYMSSQAGQPGTNGTYALSKGYVVVEPGCRGRDNGTSGDYYGVAPAAMVDLKAAIRYLRYNASLGTFSGDVNHIISSGGSAGGALSALLGASGNSSLYDPYLAAIGAADANDNIFALGAWSPITNLDHADMAYEMEYGSIEYSGSLVNQTVSAALIAEFDTYQNNLALTDKRGSLGTLTSSNITEYILTNYMEPSLEKYVAAGNSAPSYATCTVNSSSTYGYTCAFTFADYVTNSIGSRGKSEPAFDAFFDITSSNIDYNTVVNTSCTPESLEFGSQTASTDSSCSSTSGGPGSSSSGTPRHFTNFSSQAMDGTGISSDMQTIVDMMNPMYYIMNAISSGDSSGVAKYWYIRDGTIATDTSAYVIVDLATATENLLGTSNVNAWEDWGEGHNVETDPSGFSAWCTSSVAAD